MRAVDVEDPGRWFPAEYSSDRVNEVFRSPVRLLCRADRAPRVADSRPIPDRRATPVPQSPTGTFTLAGELASALVQGGAHTHFPGSPAEAMRLAAVGVADLVGDRHHFKVFQSLEPWTPWFYDVAWDHSWIIADPERLVVSILCKTDTD